MSGATRGANRGHRRAHIFEREYDCGHLRISPNIHECSRYSMIPRVCTSIIMAFGIRSRPSFWHGRKQYGGSLVVIKHARDRRALQASSSALRIWSPSRLLGPPRTRNPPNNRTLPSVAQSSKAAVKYRIFGYDIQHLIRCVIYRAHLWSVLTKPTLLGDFQ